MSMAVIGAHVRAARRRRGMLQSELARSAGVSLSLVRKLEQGDYENGLRLETVHQLAVALDVATSALMSEQDTAEAELGDVTIWEPVRRALDGTHGTQPDREPGLGGLRDALADAVSAVLGSRYAELAVTLPALLRDADALVAASSGRAEARARQARSQARQLAGYMMGQTWQLDAAASAIGLAAADPGDDLTAMAAADWQTWVLLRSGRLAECGQIAARWADDTEPRRLSKASPDDLAAWGLFCARASCAAARDNRPGEAREALRLARVAAAAAVRDAIPSFSPWQVFGPVTVAMFAAENAMIQGRPEVTLSIGAQVTGRGFPVPRNFLRHRLDVASAFAATRRYDQAAGVLAEIRAAAPEWLAQQRYARDILAMVMSRRRTLTSEILDMASFLGIDRDQPGGTPATAQ